MTEPSANCPQPEVSDQEQPVAFRTRRLSNNSAKVPSLTSASGRKRRSSGTNSGSAIAKSPCDEMRDEMVRPVQFETHAVEQLAEILARESADRTSEDVEKLAEWSFLIPAATAHLKAKQSKHDLRQRVLEQEESLESIESKVTKLVDLIKKSRFTIIYTGAGISTSASIPDYRGPNGLWTQIKKTGSFSITKMYDLTNAEPTYTHMAIKELCHRGIVKHVVSQNCDGLHLRSGIPQRILSEIHGNMYIEVCPTCERQYYREADITEKTSRFRHKTGRKCHTCAEPNNNLIDTIVLYGERSRTKWPMNWERAEKVAKRAELIICMGSSLKTLRRYGCLWPKSSSKRDSDTKLAIINLQYTSKDRQAVLKINGKCDLVMQLIMQQLNITVPQYDWLKDPLLEMAIPFTIQERLTLKRNLIFETRLQPSDIQAKNSSEARASPSILVSEITDPEKKGLKLRIRAVNVGATGSSDIKLEPDDGALLEVESLDIVPKLNGESENGTVDQKPPPLIPRSNYQVLPGWLGKCLGANKSYAPKRKKHGNKGRKHHRAAPVDTLTPSEVVAEATG